jgi:hypothetical protein
VNPWRHAPKGGGGRRGEIAMVPEAEFSSYYGRNIVKQATWKNPEVPLYLSSVGWVGRRR